MILADVYKRLEEIKACGWDYEAKDCLTFRLYTDVLTAVAKGQQGASVMARVALEANRMWDGSPK